VIPQLRSEIAKVTTTRTLAGMLAALAGLVALAIVVHTYALPVDRVGTRTGQRELLTDVGVGLGGLFAALIGALSINAEFRTGTIRPTLLATPRRWEVIVAKAATAFATGAVAAIVSIVTASLTATVALRIRDLTPMPTAGDYIDLLAGAAVGGGLLGVIGLAVGAIIRAQVPTFVGLFTWLLFIENVLAELPEAHRFVPGALAQGLAAPDREGVVQTVWLAALLLTAYASVALAVSMTATQRRDVV
jgi:ABC-type transport system involved in multi-copper enzyme maturation permease subunit